MAKEQTLLKLYLLIWSTMCLWFNTVYVCCGTENEGTLVIKFWSSWKMHWSMTWEKRSNIQKFIMWILLWEKTIKTSSLIESIVCKFDFLNNLLGPKKVSYLIGSRYFLLLWMIEANKCLCILVRPKMKLLKRISVNKIKCLNHTMALNILTKIARSSLV